MKQQIRAVVLLLLLGVFVMSCNKEPLNSKENNEKGQNDGKKLDFGTLKPIVFTKKPDKFISSVPTGNVVKDPTTGVDMYEYVTKTQKSTLLEPLSVLNSTREDVIFPGSLLIGKDFMEAVYNPLIIKGGFNPLTLSVSLKGNIPVAQQVEPVLSKVRIALNDIVAKQANNIDYQFTPSDIQCDSHIVTTEDSFKKAVGIHLAADVLNGIVKGNFDYQWEKNKSKTTKYVMVSYRQKIYNAAIDPKHYSDWIAGDIEADSFGEYEPIYISSVDYGRVAYLLVESEKSVEEVKHMVEANIAAHLNIEGVDLGLEAGFNFKKEMKKLFEENKVKVMIYGGPAQLGSKVKSYEEFLTFVEKPNAQDLVKTSMPIAYKVRRMKDNSLVKIFDLYTEVKTEFKPE